MFKATLIENTNYYNLRSKQLLYLTLSSIAIAILVNLDRMPIWITIVAIIVFVVIMFTNTKNQKAIFKVANKRIEISQNKIELKGTKGSLLETIEIENIDKLILKREYKLSAETMKELEEELKRNAEEQYIIFEKNNKQRRLDFVIESYYMLKQLKKLVHVWENNNLLIEYVE